MAQPIILINLVKIDLYLETFFILKLTWLEAGQMKIIVVTYFYLKNLKSRN